MGNLALSLGVLIVSTKGDAIIILGVAATFSGPSWGDRHKAMISGQIAAVFLRLSSINLEFDGNFLTLERGPWVKVGRPGAGELFCAFASSSFP